jgi:hypothetical protein
MVSEERIATLNELATALQPLFPADAKFSRHPQSDFNFCVQSQARIWRSCNTPRISGVHLPITRCRCLT